MNDVVLTERRGPVAWITLNRPDAMNAINGAMRERLPAVLRDADADPAVRAIVIRGAGPRAFCAGADIKEFGPVESVHAEREKRLLTQWSAVFLELRKPVIAAVHGFCLGGGLEMAVACDVRVASADASFGFPEPTRGIITGAGGSPRFARIVGLGRALDLMLTCERIDAAEAHRIGLVTRLAPAGEVEALTERTASAIAQGAPLATVATKEVLLRGADLNLHGAIRVESDVGVPLLATEDRLEAAAAFREKRPARFLGR